MNTAAVHPLLRFGLRLRRQIGRDAAEDVAERLLQRSAIADVESGHRASLPTKEKGPWPTWANNGPRALVHYWFFRLKPARQDPPARNLKPINGAVDDVAAGDRNRSEPTADSTGRREGAAERT